MQNRNTAIPAAYVFLEQEGKFLITRRRNTGYQDGNYQVPAGHIDEDELPSEAAIRETKEEVGVDIRPEDLEFVHVSYRPKHDDTDDRVDFFFRAKKWFGEVKIMEPEKCDDLRWVAPEEMPTNVSLHVRDAMRCVQEGIFFNELGFGFLKKHGLYQL